MQIAPSAYKRENLTRRADALRWFECLAEPAPVSADWWIQVKRIVPKHRTRTEDFRSGRFFYPATPSGRNAAARQSLWCSGHGYDVYASVLPRSGRDGVQAAVPGARWLWCDLDGGEDGEAGAQEVLDRACVVPLLPGGEMLPVPHLTVASGGGLHVYWRLAEFTPFDESDGGPHSREVFHKTLRRLASALPQGEGGAHADASRADCATTFRVPGTVNQKPERAGAVVAIRHAEPDAPALPYVWWRAHLPAPPVQPCVRYERRDGDPTIPRSTQNLIHTPSPAGGSHQHKMRIAYALAHAGHGLESMVLLLDTNDQISGKATPEHRRDNIALAKTALRKVGAGGRAA